MFLKKTIPYAHQVSAKKGQKNQNGVEPHNYAEKNI